ncbi:hypothetical protein D9611_002644 [Ephemerocybe angulata]|uniref:Alpha/beta hydrolase fold-3 domain-containing protein n=1 Tax=Ephemerocybe angulata TaxID=980116 RepID=A0A8H5C207_9AGAR|nr:hypothetical protein D9611_002644 [Tulosesus angulatus]
MTVNTASAAVHIAPVVVKTLVRHKKERKARKKEGREAPQDDILFDEAFHIVKSFIELGTKNTVESLQAFTNTRIPSLYWVAISPVRVPLSSCNDAADCLIKWFGQNELKKVVGGERWWQVRGLDGIDAEWIAERDHIGDEEVLYEGKRISKEEQDIIRMEKLESVMFYVHGGGYFWGSINTHRHQIIRHAHKLKGRAFTVNYRKAPQYPWPCPVQDVLAAYFYLIRPPPEALHRPVDPQKIVFCGDSAGGGLCLSVLCILRDLGLPMPSGAALISPWVDLTHSFPSVMTNTQTDIIPEHGFLAKPSVLWPLDPAPKSPRVVPATTNPPPKPGEVDTLKPSLARAEVEERGLDVPQGHYAVETQEEMLEKYPSPDPAPAMVDSAKDLSTGETSRGKEGRSVDVKSPEEIIEDWEPKPAKVLMENPSQTPLELRSQIQMYATTEQLTHPLVSPISQSSLGNLPPLYILAGDGEVLRDEIIYLAHRAAYPSQYPVRDSVLEEVTRQRENVDKFTKPTQVHLQVFDGMCHVLTVFMFTDSARYAYRSIAEFIKHVTQSPPDVVEQKPFPEYNAIAIGDTPFIDMKKRPRKWARNKEKAQTLAPTLDQEHRKDNPESDELLEQNEAVISEEIPTRSPEMDSPRTQREGGRIIMLRERVDVRGIARIMEPQDAIEVLKIPADRIGQIREAPAMRWLRGQEEWDRKYRKQGLRVLEKRKHLIHQSERLIKHALDQGLVHESFPETMVGTPREKGTGRAVKRKTSIGEIQKDRRWGPLDLKDEKPPGSAIAARRDTPEALALLRKTIYHTAPVTHQTVPRMKASDAFRATMDPHDNPNAPPRQSVAEEQVDRSQIAALNGLRIWEKILGYLARKSSSKASDGVKSTMAFMQNHNHAKEE